MLRKPEDRLTQAKRYKADNYKDPRQMFYLLMQSANIIYHGIKNLHINLSSGTQKKIV